jgi:AcrR family transcriptional regulator
MLAKIGAKPIRARPLDQRERKALLLKAALRVSARRGLGAANHTEIAREAKVSVPAVFFYFPNRGALLRDVLAEVSRFFEEVAQRIHDSDRPAPEIVIEHGRAFADAVETHPDYACVLLEWSTAIRSEAWPLYLRYYEKNLARITGTIRRWRQQSASALLADSENDARVIAATGYVIAQMKMTRVPSEKIERFLQTVVCDTLGENPAR